MLYRKLKRTWSYNDIHYIPMFKETFPELKSLSSEELCDRFASMGVDFYQEEVAEVHPLIRLTLPFAFIVIIVMILLTPVMFYKTERKTHRAYGISGFYAPFYKCYG